MNPDPRERGEGWLTPGKRKTPRSLRSRGFTCQPGLPGGGHLFLLLVRLGTLGRSRRGRFGPYQFDGRQGRPIPHAILKLGDPGVSPVSVLIPLPDGLKEFLQDPLILDHLSRLPAGVEGFALGQRGPPPRALPPAP